jgi:L-arabinokinase
MTSTYSRQPLIVFAITAHGLGHAVRTILVIKELQRLCKGLEIVVSSGLEHSTIARFLPKPPSCHFRQYEAGTIQKNCFELNPAATRARYRELYERRSQDLRAEVAFLRQIQCGGVVSDIPALPIKAASLVGIPAVGISNFTWDWILEPILGQQPGDRAIMQELASDYASGGLHLRLPFGPQSSPFPVSEPAALVARPAKQSARKVREQLGIPISRKLVVVCPGGWAPEEWPRISLQEADRYFFYLFVGDLPIDYTGAHKHLPHELIPGLSFPDLVNCADVVLAKPGYGIASECLLHQTPTVFIERPGFRETPLLVEEFSQKGRCVQLSLEDFFVGRWEQSLGQVLTSDSPWETTESNGAALAAERLAAYFNL